MEVTSPPVTKTIHEWDFHFLGAQTLRVDLDQSKKYPDTVEEIADDYYIEYRNDENQVVNLTRVRSTNLLYVEHMTRVVEILDPKLDPVRQHIETLEDRRHRAAQRAARHAAAESATPPLTE